MKLTIIIPAKNEEKRIGRTLDSYLPFFQKKFKKDFKIFVVLNGCSDNTIGEIKKRQKKYSQLIFKDIKESIGKGRALIIGFQESKSELIGYVDADLSTPPEAYLDLVEHLTKFDGCIASRWIQGARVSPKQPFSRRVASRSFNVLVNVVLGLHVKDSQCGAKVFKAYALKHVLKDLHITNWAFDINLLYLLKLHGYHIKEIPTVWHDTLGSNLKLKKASTEMFFSVLRLRLLYSPLHDLVKVYDKMPEGWKLHHRIK